MIHDFNVKSKDWPLVSKIQDLIFSRLSLDSPRLIKEPIHILDNSRSCIDLTFTSQPNMVIDSNVHASLHSNCHHQIIYAKFDLKIFIHHYMRGRCGISNMQILIISKGQLTFFIRNLL